MNIDLDFLELSVLCVILEEERDKTFIDSLSSPEERVRAEVLTELHRKVHSGYEAQLGTRR